MGKLLGIEILVHDALDAMEVQVRNAIHSQQLKFVYDSEYDVVSKALEAVEHAFYAEKAKLWEQLCPKLQAVLKQTEPKYTTLTVPDEVQYQLRDVESISCPAASRKRLPAEFRELPASFPTPEAIPMQIAPDGETIETVSPAFKNGGNMCFSFCNYDFTKIVILLIICIFPQ